MKNKIIRKRLKQDRFDAVKVLKDAKVSHKVICNILKIGNSSISRIIASNYDYEEYKATDWNEKIEKVKKGNQSPKTPLGPNINPSSTYNFKK